MKYTFAAGLLFGEKQMMPILPFTFISHVYKHWALSSLNNNWSYEMKIFI